MELSKRGNSGIHNPEWKKGALTPSNFYVSRTLGFLSGTSTSSPVPSSRTWVLYVEFRRIPGFLSLKLFIWCSNGSCCVFCLKWPRHGFRVTTEQGALLLLTTGTSRPYQCSIPSKANFNNHNHNNNHSNRHCSRCHCISRTYRS